MAAKKSFGKTVLGWFVVDENAEREVEPSADALIAKYAKQEAEAEAAPAGSDAEPSAADAPPPSVELKGDVPKAAEDGAIDFPAVYRAAQISEDEQERVTKTLGLLGTLPSSTPKDVKKQIVEASLKAFGIPVEQIIESGAQEIQALDAYIHHGERETQAVLGESSARIEELSQEILQLKQIMEKQVAEQHALTRRCNEEKLRVQTVLEFFGEEAVARVVKESPKLVEPS